MSNLKYSILAPNEISPSLAATNVGGVLTLAAESAAAVKKFGVSGALPVVTGAKGGNAALTSLISAMATLGLITDSTT